MPIRVTQQQVLSQFLTQINERKSSLIKAQDELSSGVRVQHASDDSGRAGTILTYQATLDRLTRHEQRISYVNNLLDHQNTILESSENLLERAREIGTQGANGTLSQSQRSALSKEVFQLRDQLVSLANTQYQGRYIYGGADDDDAPFDELTYTEAPTDATDSAAKRYVFDAEAGTSQTRSVKISDDDSVRVVSSGSSVFSNAIIGLERLGRALAGYKTTLSAGVPTGAGLAYDQNSPADVAAQQQEILAANDVIESARSGNIGLERADLGSRQARVEQVSSILSGLKLSTEESRASIQDSDIYEAATKFSNLQTSFQALLQSGVQINSISLLNYI